MFNTIDENDRPGQHIQDRTINWEVNESLLQSYRSIFIASQSLFISAVALTEDSTPLNFIIIFIAVLHLYIGFTVIQTRARVADFYKFNLARHKYNGVYLTENKYVNCEAARRDANSHCVTNKTNWRKTRVKVDRWIPLSFLLIWVLFFIRFIISTSMYFNSFYWYIALTLIVLFFFFIFFDNLRTKDAD